MTKRVHFANTNILYSPVSSTPSPSISESSLSSSSAPQTPPQVDYTPLQYPLTPYFHEPEDIPELFPTEIQIHFLLAFSPDSLPSIYYDLSLPPTRLDEQFPPEDFADAATNPPLKTIMVTCSHLQWPITITPSSPHPGAFVTVIDVFNSLYCALRLTVHPVEYGSLQSFEDTQDVNEAYYSRCRRIRNPDERLQEESKGVKRVDFLMGKTRFLGLSGTAKSPNIWQLNVS